MFFREVRWKEVLVKQCEYAGGSAAPTEQTLPSDAFTVRDSLLHAFHWGLRGRSRDPLSLCLQWQSVSMTSPAAAEPSLQHTFKLWVARTVLQSLFTTFSFPGFTAS